CPTAGGHCFHGALLRTTGTHKGGGACLESCLSQFRFGSDRSAFRQLRRTGQDPERSILVTDPLRGPLYAAPEPWQVSASPRQTATSLDEPPRGYVMAR